MVQKTKKAGGRPRQFDPDAALDRAVDVFWDKGYAAASLDDLTAAMGINRPSLYAAFGDKEQLFMKALERYGHGIGAEPLAAFSSAEGVGAALRAFLRTAVQNHTRPGRPTGCLFACSAAGSAAVLPPVQALYAGALKASERAIAGRLKAAIDDGELPAGFPARDRARLAVDMMQGFALRARAGESRRSLLAGADRAAALLLAPLASAEQG